jgi:hypothetical protein
LELNDQKELFSDAFIHAVSARAGCALSKPSIDRTSVDWMVHAVTGRYPQLNIQLKCTSKIEPWDDEAESFSFFLDNLKNYEDLIARDVLVPMILVVVLVPDKIADWLEVTDEHFLLRRCAYWVSLRGESPTTNTSGITIKVPVTQVFDHEALEDIMTRLEQGGLP